ncbi:MAG: hypothetical protein WCV91_02875 [Candidatus Margulisiibacteriota bacterium]
MINIKKQIPNTKKTLLFVLLLIIAIFVSFGCARTVTQIVTYGDRLVVEVTLAGTADANANRYFMVMSSSSTFKAPLPPPDNILYDELIEPGTIPFQGNIADYYTKYYSTWGAYAFVEPAGYFISPGPFVLNQASTREIVGTLSGASNKLDFTFRIGQAFTVSTPEVIYFDVLSVPWPSGTQKIATDHLILTNANILKTIGSTVTISDDPNDVVDPALNITQVKVTVQ